MHNILTALKQGQTGFTITGLRGSAAALFTARAGAATKRTLLCVVSTETRADVMEQDIGFFTDIPVRRYRGSDIPPYIPLLTDSATVAARLFTLSELLAAAGPMILVTSAEALVRKVVPRRVVSDRTELVIAGEEVDRERLVRALVRSGYDPVALVRTVGDVSLRGGIMDIFPPGFDQPIRMDFFGDTVESIRFFDPITQRSSKILEEAVLPPAKEVLLPDPDSEEMAALIGRIRTRARDLDWRYHETERIVEAIKTARPFPGIEFFLPLFYPETTDLFTYLPRDILVLRLDPLDVRRTLELVWERIVTNYQDARQERVPALPPHELFLSESILTEAIMARDHITLSGLGTLDEPAQKSFGVTVGNHQLLRQTLELEKKKEGLLAPLARHVKEWLEERAKIVIACQSSRHAEQMAEWFGHYELRAEIVLLPARPEPSAPPGLFLYGASLSEGFDLPNEVLHVLSEVELFGGRRLGPPKKGRKRPSFGSTLTFDELAIGDVVVHRDHGLAEYQGLVTLSVGGIINDFLLITFAGEDKLYVPVDRLHLIHKYKGLDSSRPRLDRLGGTSWRRTKEKVKEAVWKVAQDLLTIYAQREMKKGIAFDPPDELFREFEESFPYDETPGQQKAIDEILSDLIAERPMDRLLCGDVGYGKTEVALRAAFKVIENNRQVAVLVPTTVLAEQHAQTMRERFNGFPVRLESLNRFRTAAEQRKIVQGLIDGTVDIVIGTHRLLQKDVGFKRLGLIIIDEEHRFGVASKERLKKLRTEVEVLTLSATPIPRTLQMSLLGIRDLSVINTPPEYRQSVKTYVATLDDLVIKEVMVREIQRGGQVFFVHNRVQSIAEMAARIQRLVPEARIGVAHGQLPAKNLEEIMVLFVKKEINVLVCTTIIESGLDIPSANTIIINRADRLGLAEIHQLRGRVGRRREQAYAYLLVPSLDSLSSDAQKRLEALQEYSELGGGFKLALSDLQIRGGGNLLGVSQSGHITAVGYDLYLDLLGKTVEDLKRQEASGKVLDRKEMEPEINLRFSAFIPEGYMADISQRYLAYRRIAGASTETELLDLKVEFRDRYGVLPIELENLFEVALIKQELRVLRIQRLEQGEDSLVFHFLPDTGVEPQKILALVKRSGRNIRFTPKARLIIHNHFPSPAILLDETKKVLRALQ